MIVVPLPPAVVAELLEEKGLTPATVSDNWGLCFEDEGFLVCDRDTQSCDPREFVKRLALRTGCDVVDYSTLSLLSPDDLWQPDSIGHPDQAIPKGKVSLEKGSGKGVRPR